MLSPEPVTTAREIWVSGPGNYSERVGLSEMCGSREEAELTCGALRLWLHLGVWSERLSAMPDDAQDDVYAMRVWFWSSGADLGRIGVYAKRTGVRGDESEATDVFGNVIADKVVVTYSLYDPDGDDEGDLSDTDTLDPNERTMWTNGQ